MNVAELKRELDKFPPDAQLAYLKSDTRLMYSVDAVSWHNGNVCIRTRQFVSTKPAVNDE
jgi:hypothetical protein